MKKQLRGPQTTFNPLQTAGTKDHEESPFFHNKGTVCPTAAVSLVSQIRMELKESVWLGALTQIILSKEKWE